MNEKMRKNICFTAQSYGFFKRYQIKEAQKRFTFLNLSLNFLPSGVF